MKYKLVGFVLVTAASCEIAACSSAMIGPRDGGSYDRVELLEEGGLAAFSTTRLVNHGDRSFQLVRRHICEANCTAPLDSASGTLTASATDSLFAVVAGASPFSLGSDYGSTKNAADMIAYTLRVTANQTTKLVRADDGTMPPEMRRIVDAMHASISAARQ